MINENDYDDDGGDETSSENRREREKEWNHAGEDFNRKIAAVQIYMMR